MSRKGYSALFLFLVFIFICPLNGCRTYPKHDSIVKDGRECGVTKGAFRHRFWNYYERALSFADCELYDDARQDMLEAIHWREDDQRRARTYGDHYVDYFPHRELGVVLYYQDRIEEAIRELTLSLNNVKSAKAELYLDRARKKLIEKKRLDRFPPEIKLVSPDQDFLTNRLSIEISGVVKDDTFVREIKVQNKEVRIDVSGKEIAFTAEISIIPGENRVKILAVDLAGKPAEKFLTVHVDRVGPIIRIDDLPGGKSAPGGKAMLKVYAFDDSEIREMVVNGRTISYDGSKEIEEILTIPPDRKELKIEVVDRALNATTALIDLTEKRKGLAAAADATAKKDNSPPEIRIRDSRVKRFTFLDQGIVEGSIRDDKQVASLFINGKSILKSPGKTIYFSHLVELEPGENRIDIEGEDAFGNPGSLTINIVREMLSVREFGARLRVGMGEFKRETIGKDRKLSHGMEDLLIEAMLERRRFKVLDRRDLGELLDEIKRGQTGIVEEKTAAKIGKMAGADCMLLARILERIDSVEIYAKLVDTETSVILAAEDMYGENVNHGVLRELGDGLDWKLTDAMPVVDGIVVKKVKDQMIVDIGRNKRLKEGMKLIIYEIGEPVENPVTGEVIGQAAMEMGEARIGVIMDRMSYVTLEDGVDPDDIRPSHKIITR